MVYPSSSKTTKQNQSSRLVKILIVDDQKVVRAKLQDILAKSDRIEVVGTADDGDRAIALIETLNPDVVLMDIEMPKMNGINVTKIIARRFPESKILVLSTHTKKEYVQKIIGAGADGYILKQTPAADLIAAIDAVHRGYSHFGPKILKKVQLVERESPSDAKKIDFPTKYPDQELNLEDACQLIDPQGLAAQPESHKPHIVKPNNANNSPTLSTVKAEEFLPPIGKWLTWGGLSVVTVIGLAIPATSMLKYKTTVEAQATIRPAGELRIVQAAIPGQITDILVKKGQAVSQGDVIATIDSSRLQTEKKQLQKAIAQQRLQLSQFNAQMAVLDSQIIAETQSNNSEILAAEAELTGNRRDYSDRGIEANTQVEETQAQLKATEATLKAAQNKASRYRSAASQGALSKEQLSEAELEVQQQQQEIAATQAGLKRAMAALNPTTAEIEVTQQRIGQIQKSGQANRASLNREKEALIQQRIEIIKQLEQDAAELDQIETDLKQTNLTATATGTISELNLRNSGQALQAGQEVAQIIPGNSALEIKATVSPQDIGELETDQKVQMKVSACPYPDYGTLKGTVSQIAKDTSKPQNNTNDGSQSQQPAPAFYEITVDPEDSSFGRGQDVCQLQLGMEGNTDIVTREESVLRFILRKAKLVSNL